MRIILLGAPGSGKGTVGDRVSAATGFPRISTGDLLRDAVRKETPLGRKAKDQMGRGGLVEDALVLEILGERLAEADAREGYILDGFPRNLDQARSLEGLDGKRAEAVFLIDTSADVVVERLSSRRVCPNCGAVYNLVTKKPRREGICDVCGSGLVRRDDDRPEVVRERMRTYRTQTEPLVSYYQAKGDLIKVDGNGSVEHTFGPIKAVLDRRPAGAGNDRMERS